LEGSHKSFNLLPAPYIVRAKVVKVFTFLNPGAADRSAIGFTGGGDADLPEVIMASLFVKGYGSADAVYQGHFEVSTYI